MQTTFETETQKSILEISKLLQSIGLTERAGRIMVTLWTRGPLRGTELSKELQIDRTSVYHNLDDLEARGLIKWTSIRRKDAKITRLFQATMPHESIQLLNKEMTDAALARQLNPEDFSKLLTPLQRPHDYANIDDTKIFQQLLVGTATRAVIERELTRVKTEVRAYLNHSFLNNFDLLSALKGLAIQDGIGVQLFSARQAILEQAEPEIKGAATNLDLPESIILLIDRRQVVVGKLGGFQVTKGDHEAFITTYVPLVEMFEGLFQRL